MLLSPLPLASSVLAQDATPTAKCAATMKDLDFALFDAETRGHDAASADLLTPELVYHELPVDVPMATPKSGAEGAAAWTDEREQEIADLTVTVDPIIADGDLVSAIMAWNGTGADSGSNVTWNSAGFFRIDCGKIAENWVVADALGRLVTSGDITQEELATVTAEGTPAP